jgi:hypothetical protein
MPNLSSLLRDLLPFQGRPFGKKGGGKREKDKSRGKKKEGRGS